MFQLRIFLSWNDVGSSWWGCEPRDYARSGRWPPLTPSLGSQPHHSAPTSIHSGKIPSWNKIFCDLGYPLSKSLAGKFEVFPSWLIFILSCLKEQENIILGNLVFPDRSSFWLILSWHDSFWQDLSSQVANFWIAFPPNARAKFSKPISLNLFQSRDSSDNFSFYIYHISRFHYIMHKAITVAWIESA